MKTFMPFLVVFFCLLFFFSCQKSETPDFVSESYDDLCKNIDKDQLGKGIKELKAFKERSVQYKIADKVTQKIEALGAKVEGRFAKARDLVREENLERAEKILQDLAIDLSETNDGKMAKEYLRFEFPMSKANHLLVNRQFDKAKSVLLELRKNKLTANETQHLERLFDSIANTEKAQGMAGKQKFKAACKIISISLKKHYAEWGEYPKTLTLKSEVIMKKSPEFLSESVSGIENYKAGKKGFSMTVVGTNPDNKANITQKGVEIND